MHDVRPFHAASGKARFSQRSGMTPFVRAGAMFNAPVRLLSQIMYDSRKFTYSASAGSQEWASLTTDVRNGVRDRQGNLYVIEGSSTVTKLNDAGTAVWHLNPPMADGRHVLSAIDVDDQDNLFVGASSGGDQKSAKFWRFKQRTGGQTPTVAWTETPNAFVKNLIVKGDLIYTLQNMPDRAQAFVVVYRGALSTGLTEAWRTEVSYPANEASLKADGSVIWCSPANANRGLDPRFRNFTERTVDWRLTDLADFDRRVFAWWKAADQPGHYGNKLASKGTNTAGETVPILQDGDDLPVFYDSSGNARDLFTSIRVGSLTPPKYDAEGIGGKPSILFRGQAGSATYLDELQSGGSTSETAALSDAQRGLIPSYVGAKSCMFIVARLEDDRSGAPATQAIFGINRATGGVGNAVSLFANRNDAGAVAAGIGSYVDLPPAGGLGLGAGGQPLQFNYGEAASGTYAGNNTGTVILTIINDGGDVSLPDSAAITHSLLRVNGQPIDRWVSAAGTTTDAGFLGYFHGVAALKHFRGHIAEIIVLRDLTSAPKGLLSHPNYPRNVGTTVANIYQAVTTTNATEMEFIEGMLAHEYGISHLLPTGAYIPPVLVGPIAPGNYPHPFYRTAGPPRSPGSGVRSEPYQIHSKAGVVGKLDGSKGELQWVVTGSGSEDGGGLGYWVGVHDDDVWSVGPKLAVGSALIDGTVSAVGTGNINVRKFKDLNLKGVLGYDTSIVLGASGWTATLGTTADDFNSSDVYCALDDFQNLYVPTPYSAIGPFLFKVYASAPDVSGGFNAGNELLTYGTDQGARVVATPTPSYRFGAAYDFDRNPASDARQARTELVYALTTAGVQKIRLVTATPINGSPRQTALYAVNSGVLRRFDGTTYYPLAGASTIAEPQLSTSAQYIDSCILFGKLFITDGSGYYYVSPIDDSMRTWKPSDGGKMEPRRKLLCAWRGRAVLARGVDDPHIWDMSYIGDPFKWDRFPVPLAPERAVSGVDSRIGACPDVINALFPFSDDILLFFCDHSIWAIDGDPADPGRAVGFRQVSGTIGGSFGRSVCTDPEGNVYFHSSQGDVYVMGAGGHPKCISDSISAELRDIDLSVYRAELCWNLDEDCLHVEFVPWSEGTGFGYAWSRGTKAWCPDTRATATSALLVADGDLPGDRKILLGRQDGPILFWDRDAKNDDGDAISHSTLIGPLAGEAPDFEYRFKGLNIVAARDHDGFIVRVYGSDTPDRPGSVRGQFQVEPGRNATFPVNICAPYVWVEVLGSHPQRSFSIESMRFLSVERGPRRRVGVTL